MHVFTGKSCPRLNIKHCQKMSHSIRKPTICICDIKGADQLRGNCQTDQRLCFCYTDSTIPLLQISKISSFQLASVTVQAGLCRTWSETTLLVFSRHGSDGFDCLDDNIKQITVLFQHNSSNNNKIKFQIIHNFISFFCTPMKTHTLTEIYQPNPAGVQHQ